MLSVYIVTRILLWQEGCRKASWRPSFVKGYASYKEVEKPQDTKRSE